MPQIATQETVLNGRGRVLLYANGNGAGNWYYKEYVKAKRSYREKKIESHSSSYALAVCIAYNIRGI